MYLWSLTYKEPDVMHTAYMVYKPVVLSHGRECQRTGIVTFDLPVRLDQAFQVIWPGCFLPPAPGSCE